MGRKRRAITAQLGSLFDDPEAERSRAHSDVRPKYSSDATAQAPCVLVVDDEDTSRANLVETLRRIYRVDEAESAAMAIARCANNKPDVILFNADRSDVSSKRLETLLGLAMGEERPPVVVLSDTVQVGSEPGGELLLREDEPPDAITLVSLLERALAGDDDDDDHD